MKGHDRSHEVSLLWNKTHLWCSTGGTNTHPRNWARKPISDCNGLKIQVSIPHFLLQIHYTTNNKLTAVRKQDLTSSFILLKGDSSTRPDGLSPSKHRSLRACVEILQKFKTCNSFPNSLGYNKHIFKITKGLMKVAYPVPKECPQRKRGEDPTFSLRYL